MNKDSFHLPLSVSKKEQETRNKNPAAQLGLQITVFSPNNLFSSLVLKLRMGKEGSGFSQQIIMCPCRLVRSWVTSLLPAAAGRSAVVCPCFRRPAGLPPCSLPALCIPVTCSS